MLFECLELTNIRSHVDTVVDFPRGLVLLAGDIGAGKSSVLQAIEFALFGIRRGDVAGEGLLRHGEKDGSVTLTFSLAGKRVVVHRALKRTKDSVRQDSGFLEVDGSREELTAREIKARVLELLGYPDELITKSKGFVYRYTVYAPQEEMKQIVYESAANRLDVLRSVFDVEKYKRVAENSSLVAKQLRDQARFFEGQVEDLSELVDEREELVEQRAEVEEQLAQVKKKEAQASEHVQKVLEAGEALEEAHEADVKRREQLRAAQARSQALTKQLEELRVRQRRVTGLLEQEVEPVADPSETRKKLRLLREKSQSAATQARTKIQSLKQDVESVQTEVSRVAELDVCPKCRQPVGEDHKHDIKSSAQERLEELTSSIEQYEARLKKAKNNLDKLREREALLVKREEAYAQFVKYQQRVEAARERVEEFSEQEASLEERLVASREEVSSLSESSFDKQAYADHKREVEAAREALQQVREQRVALSERMSSFDARKQRLEKRIQAKKQSKQTLALIRSREQWLKRVFDQAVSTVERYVMSSIHKEFSAKFTEWFMQLLEDDGLYAELDASFAPVLTQDGYDVDLRSLSGGERQSVALAYRLALNNVVNAVVKSLRTSDVLVLDEPTDGFSDAQLDRVRDVLSQLPCDQVLLVSHEQKMQSFVDSVVRVEKRGGVSVVE